MVAQIISQLQNVGTVILEAHGLLLIVLSIDYFLEKTTGISVFVDQFLWEKSLRNAEINIDRDSWLYFLWNLAFLIYILVKNRIEFSITILTFWLLIMLLLLKPFRYFYDKYQKVDSEKADDDYT